MNRKRTAAEPRSREQELIDSLKFRAIHHSARGRRVFLFERITVFLAAVAQIGVVLALAGEYLTPTQSAVATVLPGALLALLTTMGWRAQRRWRYQYHNDLESLRDRLVFDMITMEEAVLEKAEMAKRMHEQHPQLKE